MDDGEPPAKVPKIEESDVKKEEVDEVDKEWTSLVEKCIKALELIIQRFPDHFKAFHLLARYYIRSKVSHLKTYFIFYKYFLRARSYKTSCIFLRFDPPPPPFVIIFKY